MHGIHFMQNITPVIAMIHSAVGRRPTEALRKLREKLLADDATRKIWDDYQIESPLVATSATIESPIGTFRYQTINPRIPDALLAIVIQVPDEDSRERWSNRLKWPDSPKIS
jgi:hypothetical protein